MRKKIGTIGVDAGLCWIGDPCYILHKDKPSKSIGKNWEEFCDKIGEFHTQFNFNAGHEGLGVCVSTGMGDGSYPVYAEIEKCGKFGKRVKSVTIVFISQDEIEDIKEL